MLSDRDIKQAIQSGELTIDPYFEDSIRACGILLHLGHNLLKPLPGQVVDVRAGTVPEYQAVTLISDKPYPLAPGEFMLGHTYERVTVGPSLGFLIEGRSTLARVGLTIVQTAMMVYPGHRQRSITLELANHGPNTIMLYPKMKIARAAILELKTPSLAQYDDLGKYRNQNEVGGPIFQNEILED